MRKRSIFKEFMRDPSLNPVIKKRLRSTLSMDEIMEIAILPGSKWRSIRAKFINVCSSIAEEQGMGEAKETSRGAASCTVEISGKSGKFSATIRKSSNGFDIEIVGSRGDEPSIPIRSVADEAQWKFFKSRFREIIQARELTAQASAGEALRTGDMPFQATKPGGDSITIDPDS